MPILFVPAPGTILLCDYEGHIPPEMDKRRPVVVVSPPSQGRHKLATIVALSTTAPNPVMPFHCQITVNPTLPPPFNSPVTWVKGDMLFTASYDRLDRFKMGKNPNGTRIYKAFTAPQGSMPDIHKAVINGLGLGRLSPHI
jgi:uncharacterized protein YifN (PemK superfamily)